MEKNKKKKSSSEDLSVDELVSLLRDNISSDRAPDEGAEEISGKKITKKQDPDKDIASMLKRFMPEESEEPENFELDDTISEEVPEVSVNEDFELEGDAEEDSVYDVEVSASDDEKEVQDFDVEEGNDADFDDQPFADDFAEPIDSEDAFSDDAESDESSEKSNKKQKKKHKGLFGFGKKKGGSLAKGYAKMLEEDSEPEEYLDDSEFEFAYSDMPEVGDITGTDKTDISVKPLDEGSLETPDTDEGAASRIFMFENEPEKDEPEDEYFVPEKKPLVFDKDDEKPFVPDEAAFEAAFADVAPADISEFEEAANDGDDEISFDDSESSELDDKNINLMIGLGYEDELEKTIGKENVDVISDQLNAEIVDFIDVDSAYAFDGFELNSSDSFSNVGEKYKKENAKMKLRLLVTGIFTAVLFVFELLGMLGVTFDGALNVNQYPVVVTMLSLQLLVLASVMSWKQILEGLYNAVTFNPTPASIPSAALLLTVLYDIIMALIAPHTGLHLYNFPAALCVLFLVLNDYFNLSREIRAFNTIATRRPKYAVSTASSDKSADEEMISVFGESVVSDFDEKILETRKVSFIDNYFRRTNIRSQKNRNLCFMIYPFIILAVILGIISFVMNKNGVTAFNVSILTVLFGMPLSSLFVNSYTFFSAVNVAFDKDATIIGEESVEEYSNASTVVFADKEVFPVEATVTRGIKLYDNNAIYYVLYHLTSLYSKIGGPLKSRLEQATTELGHSEDVEIVRIDETGVEAVVDGKVRVLAGQSAFMTENGIEIDDDPDDDGMISEGASALYLALDGVLSAKLYVDYEVDPVFKDVIETLSKENMNTVIRTADPNIDDELLARKVKMSQLSVKIQKCCPGDNADVGAAEAGVVARNSISALADTLCLCNKIRRVRSTSKKIGVLSMVVSVIIMILIAMLSSKPEISSIYVALYQIFWLAPLALFTKLFIK